ncbi:MAG TPA: septum site-determining protein MinC [Polyangia bacterium]|nr:septum site-determining protein MinC [Polyangia bacterium]
MSASRRHAGSDAFEIDGSVAPVTVLRLKTVDVARIDKELRARAASVRQMFPYAPVVVDVAELDEASALELPLHDLAERLRACQLIPLGAANLPPSAVWNAAAAGMAVIQLAAAPTTPVEPPRIEPPTPAVSTLTIRQPVRSGQVIYAQRADLVVLAPVNAGAQVIADGHIHVYGPLRGRALAGAQGMADACVFCQSLEAELVSIAGQYLVADEIPAEHRGARVQLSVEGGHFRIQPL